MGNQIGKPDWDEVKKIVAEKRAKAETVNRKAKASAPHQIIVQRQEIMKVREVILHTGPIPIIIPLKLFLDLLRDVVSPRGLTDSQSHVPIFTNVDS